MKNINFKKITECFLFVFLFLIAGAKIHAQDTVDSIPHKKAEFDPAFDFDQRYSFINRKPVNIWGSRFGIFIHEKFKIGIGGYFLNDHQKNQTLDLYPSQVFNEHRKLLFGTAYFEPFLFRHNLWELSIPFEAGYGKSSFKFYSSSSGLLVNTISKKFIPIGAGLSLSFKCPPLKHFKPLRWFGINAIVGYRYCTFEDKFEGEYNGVFWCLSATIFVDRITDDCREWKKQRLIRNQNINK